MPTAELHLLTFFSLCGPAKALHQQARVCLIFRRYHEGNRTETSKYLSNLNCSWLLIGSSRPFEISLFCRWVVWSYINRFWNKNCSQILKYKQLPIFEHLFEISPRCLISYFKIKKIENSKISQHTSIRWTSNFCARCGRSFVGQVKKKISLSRAILKHRPIIEKFGT